MYRLPEAKPEQVVLIQDDAVCRRAAEAYGDVARQPNVPLTRRRMAVVRVRDRYVVDDVVTPIRAGEFTTTIVFDMAWRFLVGIDS